MAKRYLLDTIVGTGTREDPYRASVRGLPGINTVMIIPTGPDGRPVRDVCFVRVGGMDLSGAVNKIGVDPLPDFPLDAKLQAMATVTKTMLRSRLTARGFDGAGLTENNDGFRDLVRGVGQSLEPEFDEERFDVQETPSVVGESVELRMTIGKLRVNKDGSKWLSE